MLPINAENYAIFQGFFFWNILSRIETFSVLPFHIFLGMNQGFARRHRIYFYFFFKKKG
jgi:hypothetical protein